MNAQFEELKKRIASGVEASANLELDPVPGTGDTEAIFNFESHGKNYRLTLIEVQPQARSSTPGG